MLHPMLWSRLAFLWKSITANPVRPVRPELEGLEDRCLLAPVSLPTLPDGLTRQARHGLAHPEKHARTGLDRLLHGNLPDLWADARGGRYRQPTAAELRRAEQLFLRTLLLNESVTSLRRAWQRLDFDLLTVTSGGETFL